MIDRIKTALQKFFGHRVVAIPLAALAALWIILTLVALSSPGERIQKAERYLVTAASDLPEIPYRKKEDAKLLYLFEIEDIPQDGWYQFFVSAELTPETMAKIERLEILGTYPPKHRAEIRTMAPATVTTSVRWLRLFTAIVVLLIFGVVAARSK